jgi:hypothetical protein
MAASTKRFNLSISAYTDVSEGSGSVSFRIPHGPWSGVRVVLATSLPAASTTDYDDFLKATPTEKGVPSVSFTGLASTDRVYAMSLGSANPLTVYRL